MQRIRALAMKVLHKHCVSAGTKMVGLFLIFLSFSPFFFGSFSSFLLCVFFCIFLFCEVSSSLYLSFSVFDWGMWEYVMEGIYPL